MNENEIKILRKRAGMTQEQFSETYDIPLNTLKNWEAGRRTPPTYVKNLLEYRIAQDSDMRMKYGRIRNERN